MDTTKSQLEASGSNNPAVLRTGQVPGKPKQPEDDVVALGRAYREALLRRAKHRPPKPSRFACPTCGELSMYLWQPQDDRPSPVEPAEKVDRLYLCRTCPKEAPGLLTYERVAGLFHGKTIPGLRRTA